MVRIIGSWCDWCVNSGAANGSNSTLLSGAINKKYKVFFIKISVGNLVDLY